jgi:flagellar biosynthetic protein FliP
VLLMMTGFTRIVIVLSLLRQALGTQSAPPNQVVVGLSLFLTFFVMGPTIDRVYT